MALQPGFSACAHSGYVAGLIEPGTLYGDRLNQVDLRFSKLLRFGSARRVRLMADVYNALNASPVITVNTTYNANQAANNWMRPTQILVGRFLKVGAQFDF